MPELRDIIGSSAETIVWWQMVIRAVLIFLYLWALVRVGDRRTFSHISAFDVVVGMILGSTLSRALTGNAPFVPTLLAAGVLIVLHRLAAKAAFRSSDVEVAIKGRELQLVRTARCCAMR